MSTPVDRIPVEILMNIFCEVIYSPIFQNDYDGCEFRHLYTSELESQYRDLLKQRLALQLTSRFWKYVLDGIWRHLVIASAEINNRDVPMDTAYRLTMCETIPEDIICLTRASSICILDIKLPENTCAQFVAVLPRIPTLRALYLLCREHVIDMKLLSQGSPKLENFGLLIGRWPIITSPLILNGLTYLKITDPRGRLYDLDSWKLPNLLRISLEIAATATYKQLIPFG